MPLKAMVAPVLPRFLNSFCFVKKQLLTGTGETIITRSPPSKRQGVNRLPLMRRCRATETRAVVRVFGPAHGFWFAAWCFPFLQLLGFIL